MHICAIATTVPDLTIKSSAFERRRSAVAWSDSLETMYASSRTDSCFLDSFAWRIWLYKKAFEAANRLRQETRNAAIQYRLVTLKREHFGANHQVVLSVRYL